MFSSAEKGAKPASLVRAKAESAPFFRKAGGEESFFGARSSGAFFQPVQAKLDVSHPSDPQEKEADAVAEHVMRMPAPGGKIGHAEIKIGDSPVMLADESPEMGSRSLRSIGGSPITLMIYDKDVDAYVAVFDELAGELTG